MDEARPGYYAIIPADVRYDDQIPPNAKLLYGEISALINKEGFCFASNDYFMKLYGFSDPTISRLITALVKAGYIKRELEKDNSGQVTRRKLYLSVSAPQIQPPIKIDTTSYQNCGEGGIKNDGYTNTSITDIKKENKKERKPTEKADPLTDEGLQALFVEWLKRLEGELWTNAARNAVYLALQRFYAPRSSKKQEPARSAVGFTALSGRLVRLSQGNPGAMIEMLDVATTSLWKSVFPLHGSAPQEEPAQKEEEVWLN